MEFKAAKPINLMAVLVDADSRKAEVIDVDTLAEQSFVINHGTESMLMAYQWGGYDSNGKFHVDHTLGASQITITAAVDGEREIWHTCARCPKGNPIRNHDEAFKRKIMIDHGQLEKVVNGGWHFKDGIELHHAGAPVFTKAKAADKGDSK